MYLLISPVSVALSKAKRFGLNLNIYRNAYYQTLNRAKKSYHNEMKAQVRKLPKLNHVHITYILYMNSRIKVDVSNVCSIADKFFSDVLVAEGKIPDDNYAYLSKVTYRFGGVVNTDRSYIKIIIEEDKEMRITLFQEDIVAVMNAHFKDSLKLPYEVEHVSIETTEDGGIVCHYDLKKPTVISTEQPKVASTDNSTGSDETVVKHRTRRTKAEILAAQNQNQNQTKPEPEPEPEETEEPEVSEVAETESTVEEPKEAYTAKEEEPPFDVDPTPKTPTPPRKSMNSLFSSYKK